ncbi:MAG: hypothetical protein IJC18_04750, partial [Clostridia bacterium]|nr:hypothetical protein [Clostridia bacterium]
KASTQRLTIPKSLLAEQSHEEVRVIKSVHAEQPMIIIGGDGILEDDDMLDDELMSVMRRKK